MNYDVIVIGGGVVGASVIDALSRYKLSLLLLEKGDDVAVGASRANSGIVHAGYDCEPNTLKAKFNARGNKLMWQLAKTLRVPHLKCGSLVVSDKDHRAGLEELLKKAKLNGVKAQILTREQTLEIEPNISDSIAYSLYAPEAGVISPYQFTIALADRSVLNGAQILTECRATSLCRENGFWKVTTDKGDYYAKSVINCAGGEAASINDAAGAEHYETKFRKGDYFVLDNTERKNVKTVIFPLPTEAGKGILIAPTADGNVIYGPTSVECEAENTATDSASLNEIRRNVPLTYSKPAFNKCIRTYAGVRAVIGNDITIKRSQLVPDFIMAAGICSPGLTSSPAIAEHITELVGESIELTEKEDYIENLPHKPDFKQLSKEEVNLKIKTDPRWGRIVCRCEKVTEAEIVAAIRSPLPAKTVDAVKRRCRAGMGRCQGGFCSTRVMEIISRELNIPLSCVRKGAEGSEIAKYRIDEAPYD